MSTFTSISVAAAAIVFAAVAPATSAPTPIPGGANEVSAVAGTTDKPVWNGVVKVTLSPVRDATQDEAKDVSPGPSQKALAFTVLLRNGSHATFGELLSYQLADANDISFEIPNYHITHEPLSILQGGAQMQKAIFNVDKDFVPTKLIVQCPSCSPHTGFRPIRFALAP